MKVTGNHLKGFWTKKKILLVSLALIFAIGAGVTTAYMWKQGDTKTATFGEAHVDCEVTTENNIYYVKNTGNVDCYVRVTFTVNFMDNEGNLHYTKPIAGTHYELVTSTSGNWIKGADGYWYYKEAISPKEKTLTGVVKVTPHNTNLPQGYSLKAIVNAEAVQALPQYTNMTDDIAYQDAWASLRATAQAVPQAGMEVAKLKVMTLDVRQAGYESGTAPNFIYNADREWRSWHARKDALIDYVYSQNCDLIILQGVSLYQRDDFVDEKPANYGYKQLGYRNYYQFNIQGLMILYNTNKLEQVIYKEWPTGKIDEYGEHFAKLTDHDTEFKTTDKWIDYYAMTLSLAFKLKNPPAGTPENTILYVHNLHMQNEDDTLQKEAAQDIKGKIEDRTAEFPNSIHLVAGNFNSVYENSSWKNTFDQAGLLNCQVSNQGPTLHGNWPVDTTKGDFPLFAPNPSTIGNNPIDYVFGQSGRVRWEGFTIDNQSTWNDNGQQVPYSYHYPVIGTVTLYAPLEN